LRGHEGVNPGEDEDHQERDDRSRRSRRDCDSEPQRSWDSSPQCCIHQERASSTSAVISFGIPASSGCHDVKIP
jgi:hypothetical protein